jgi:hypothetical protein
MAIIDSHPRIKVEILSNDAPLQEYDNDEEEDKPNSVTKYIEAQSGAAFEIRCSLERPFPKTPLLCKCFVDGKKMEGFFCGPASNSGSSCFDKLSGVTHHDQVGTFLSKFCFSDLTVGMSQLQKVCACCLHVTQMMRVTAQCVMKCSRS